MNRIACDASDLHGMLSYIQASHLQEPVQVPPGGHQ